MDIINTVKTNWNSRPGATDSELKSAEKIIGQTLPNDISAFMQWSNGGNCKFPNIYIDLWPIQAIPKLNNEYQITRYLGKSFVGIGTDGGPTCIAINYSEHPPSICTFDLGDIGKDGLKKIATSFSDFILQAASGKLTDNTIYP